MRTAPRPLEASLRWHRRGLDIIVENFTAEFHAGVERVPNALSGLLEGIDYVVPISVF